MDLKLTQIKESINNFKNKIKIKRNVPNLKLTFRTSMINKIKNELNADNSNIVNLESETNRERFNAMIDTFNMDLFNDTRSSYKAVNTYLGTRANNMSKNAIDSINVIKELELQENAIKANIYNLKKVEMDRIFKEFLLHDYERRFNVKKETVIAALIGEDSIMVELSRQSREKRVCFF
jgi:hypothetical protein